MLAAVCTSETISSSLKRHHVSGVVYAAANFWTAFSLCTLYFPFIFYFWIRTPYIQVHPVILAALLLCALQSVVFPSATFIIIRCGWCELAQCACN